ncbi:MAG: hypothetical protein JOZ51_09370 [Chloroflexi bacterium]|nr:hypothetical protein [Chloroflexota bacterium]
MSFHWYARKSRNPQLTIFTRRAAFYSCISSYCWLTEQSFTHVRATFIDRFTLEGDRAPSEQQLAAALAALEVERHLFLERLRVFDRRRIRQKLRGQRRPRSADVQALYGQSYARKMRLS